MAPSLLQPVRCGPDPHLDAVAEEILMEDRRRFKDEDGWRYADLNGWLTEEQLRDRYRREVYTETALGEYREHRGVFGRVYNPKLNHRPSLGCLWRPGMDPWNQLLWEAQGDNWSYHPGRMQYPQNNIADRRPWPDDYPIEDKAC